MIDFLIFCICAAGVVRAVTSRYDPNWIELAMWLVVLILQFFNTGSPKCNEDKRRDAWMQYDDRKRYISYSEKRSDGMSHAMADEYRLEARIKLLEALDACHCGPDKPE